MQKIAIYGAGGLGREVLVLIRQINLRRPQWQVSGFFDDNLQAGESVHGITVLGDMEVLNTWQEELAIVIAIGDAEAKSILVHKITNPFIRFATLIHPDVEIEDFQFIEIGEGSVLGAGCVLTTDIKIGKHVLLNLDCTVGHDVVMGDYCSVMPGCHISGEVKIGEGCYLGTGSAIINKVNLGPYSIIGAGAVVIKDVAGHSTAVGVPAKRIEKNHK